MWCLQLCLSFSRLFWLFRAFQLVLVVKNSPNNAGRSSLVAQMVENLPAMWETRVWSLVQEDTLEKELAIDSRTLTWRIPWTEEPSRLKELDTTEQLIHAHTHTNQEMQIQSLGQGDPSERARQSTLVFLPAEFYGQRSLADYSPQGCKESDTTSKPLFLYLCIFGNNGWLSHRALMRT